MPRTPQDLIVSPFHTAVDDCNLLWPRQRWLFPMFYTSLTLLIASVALMGLVFFNIFWNVPTGLE
jgi:hypothetical protein